MAAFEDIDPQLVRRGPHRSPLPSTVGPTSASQDGGGGGTPQDGGGAGAKFGEACTTAPACESKLCGVINSSDGKSYSLDPATSWGGATGMCTVACDFNTDCKPPEVYWCAQHDRGVTATNPDGRYCVHR